MTGPSRPAADLEEIVSRFRRRDYRISEHALARAADEDRPNHLDVEWGVTKDRPRIITDDGGIADPRGPVVTIECEAENGQTLWVRVNYGRERPIIVTQFWRTARR